MADKRAKKTSSVLAAADKAAGSTVGNGSEAASCGHWIDASRTAEMREITAAVAHELNQPLYAISNFAWAARRALQNVSDPTAIQAGVWVEEICRAADRAAQMLRQFRTMTQEKPLDKTMVDPVALVRESLRITATRGGRRCIERVAINAANDLPNVFVDPLAMQLAIAHLLDNALDATADTSNTGKVFVRVARTDDTVDWAVADNGPGVSPEVEDRLFYAFASTKPGRLGLGLAVSRAVAQRHGGRLAYRRRQGETLFSIAVPLVDRSIESTDVGQ